MRSSRVPRCMISVEVAPFKCRQIALYSVKFPIALESEIAAGQQLSVMCLRCEVKGKILDPNSKFLSESLSDLKLSLQEMIKLSLSLYLLRQNVLEVSHFCLWKFKFLVSHVC